MKSIRSTSVLLTLALMAALLASCSSQSDESQTLTIYSGRSEEFIAPFLAEFASESGVTLDVRYGDSAALAAQILEEGENSPADIFLSQDAGALGALGSEGLIAPLSPTVLSRVDDSYRSRAGDWVGITGRARVFAYAPDRVSQLPQSIDDLVDASWRGRIGIAPTNSSFQAFITAFIQANGEAAAENWLTAIKKNDPQIFEKNSQIVEAIDAGQIDLGLVNHYYLWEVSEELGREINAEIGFFQSGDIGNLINVSGAALLKTSKRTDHATALISFLLSDDIQQRFVRDTHEYSLVLSALQPEGLPALRDVKAPAVDLSTLSDLRRTQALLIKVGLI